MSGPGFDVAPFVATSYADPEALGLLTAPAYDLIPPEERARLIEADPRSVVHLTLPTFGPEDAADRLARWRADGTFAVDDRPALYLYELSEAGHSATRGWVGAVALDAPLAPHEATVPAAVADRTRLRVATDADLEPIVLAHDGPPGEADAVGHRMAAGRAPAVDLRDDAGVRHRLWRVADPDVVAAVAADLRGRRAVVADGHHRLAAARADRAARPGPGPHDRLLALVVPTDMHGPRVRAIHRVLPGVGLDAVLARGAGRFRVEELPAPGGPPRASVAVGPVDGTGPAGAGGAVQGSGAGADGAARSGGEGSGRRPASEVAAGAGSAGAAAAGDVEALLASATATVLLLTDGRRWARLTEPDREALVTAPPAWRALDVALADVGLGGAAPDVLLRPGAESAVASAVETGGVAVLLRPTSTATVLDLAAHGVLMPRKSTLFVPKPRTGLVLRCFADQRRPGGQGS